MAARLPTIVASNYGCETALSKSSDSTAGFRNNPPTSSTDSLNSAPYVINSGSDTFPLINGAVAFDLPIMAPGASALSLGTVDVSGGAASMLSLFPANFNSNCIVNVTAGGGVFNLTTAGYVNNIPTTPIVQGFNNTAIVTVAGNGTAVTAVSFVQTYSTASDLLVNYVAPGGPGSLTFTVTVQKLVGSAS
jgi:hypothetical protein